MDVVLISKYLTDKDKVRLIKINNEFYDNRFFIKFFMMRLKKNSDTDIVNFKCFKITGSLICARSPNLFDKVTMLKMNELKSYNMSSCINVTHLYINRLTCILPDTHMPPRLIKTIVDTVNIKDDIVKNKFTKTITKIKSCTIHGNIDDNIFENCGGSELVVYFVRNVNTKILTKFVTKLFLHGDRDQEINLNALHNGCVTELNLETIRKINLSKVITSLVKLVVGAQAIIKEPVDLSGIEEDCLPNLKQAMFCTETKCDDYTVLGNLDYFRCDGMKNAITPTAKSIYVRIMDMMSCVFHDNLVALDVHHFESINYNVINKLKFFRTHPKFYSDNIDCIKNNSVFFCDAYDWIKLKISNIKHKHLIVGSFCFPGIGVECIFFDRVLSEHVTHLIVLDHVSFYLRIQTLLLHDGLKLFACRDVIDFYVRDLPETLEEIYFTDVDNVQLLLKFKNLKRIGCNDVRSIKNIIKAEEYIEADSRNDIYALLVRLYPDTYFNRDRW